MTRARRIALVDADCDAQQELSRALTARGWTVSVHSTIREATEGLLAAPPDLMIVEVQLPDGLGLNLIDIVRGDDGAHIPSIVVSHRATEQDVMRGFAAGAVDYVSKPVRLPELIARCRVHLTRLS
jgi:DNA-binding response OmpR family regulator